MPFPAVTRRSLALGAGAVLASTPAWRAAAAPAAPFSDLDATAQAALVRRKEVTAAELVEAAITRIESLDPVLNAVVSRGFDQARARAATSIAGPFGGVPYLIKDLVEYPGLPHRSGSRMTSGVASSFRSDYMARTDAAGLIVLGKSATPEFGLIPTTEPLLGPPTRNPWNIAYSPGGSSGGSAAAVASGMVAFAHASDGGGSIRIPASCCGLFGLKPSRGRQPPSRRETRTPDLSVEHCLSRSVRDSATLLALTEAVGSSAGLPPVGLVSGPSKRRLRIGWYLTDMSGRQPDPEVARAIRATARLCADLGHEVVESRLPFSGAAFLDHFKVVWSAGAAGVVAGYRARAGREPDETVLEPFTLAFARYFAAQAPDRLPAALAHLGGVEQACHAYFGQFDVLLSPVLAKPSVPIGHLAPTVPFDELWDRMVAYATYTPWQNVAGVPAMSVPLFRSSVGLPIGSQFTAGLGQEATLLNLAFELERARPWRAHWPKTVAGGGK
ncbi:amidase [Phenylobacterium sp.]|uniref:amidase n=1 Tax=Phenylobacterium sp. TaxID=1871053 RepID=UPI002FC661E8